MMGCEVVIKTFLTICEGRERERVRGAQRDRETDRQTDTHTMTSSTELLWKDWAWSGLWGWPLQGVDVLGLAAVLLQLLFEGNCLLHSGHLSQHQDSFRLVQLTELTSYLQ